MTSKPRVSAGHHTEAARVQSHDRSIDYTSPAVDIEVAFDLHDHVLALAALDRAVADVKSQIGETK